MSGGNDCKKTEHHKFIKEEHIKATLTADIGNTAELITWSIEDFTEKGDNYATVVTSVRVTYTMNGKQESKSYIVKINPDQGIASFKPFIASLFKKEAGFYSQVAPALNAELQAVNQEPLHIPKHFYHSLETGQEVIYFEDLRRKNFRMFDRKKGLDVAHAQLVFKELARLHAASVLLQEKHKNVDLADRYNFLNIDWHNYSENAEENFALVFRGNMENAAEMLHRIGGYESCEKWLIENKTNPINIFKRNMIRKAPFDLICHGDCWNNNLLFRYDDEDIPVEVMLLDFQLSRKASPTTDLNYLMFTSLNGDVRRPNVENFLSIYHSSFSTVMQSATIPVPFTFQQLLQEYKSKMEYGFLFATMSVLIIVTPSEDIPDFRDIREGDLEKKLLEWKETSQNLMEKNPLFKPRFLSLFDDMIQSNIADQRQEPK